MVLKTCVFVAYSMRVTILVEEKTSYALLNSDDSDSIYFSSLRLPYLVCRISKYFPNYYNFPKHNKINILGNTKT